MIVTQARLVLLGKGECLMGKIIVVANQKGGVGKTTTSVNLAASLGKLGKRILLVDIDPQGNASSGVGIDKNEVENTVYQLMIGEATAAECIVKDVYPGLSVIPSSIDLAAAELELSTVEKKEFLLYEELGKIKSKYDVIIIDCPPSLNVLTINAMVAADSILIPIQCEYYALEGLSQLMHTISLVQERLNHEMQIEGIVFTMFDGRTNLSQQVVENVQENMKIHIFKSMIPRNVRLAEAPSYGMPITEYDPRSAGAIAYEKLAREIMKIRRKKK